MLSEKSRFRVSIITINFNNLQGLKRTVDSVHSQLYKQFEHIIIDGNSNDGSQSFIQERSSHFGYWISEPDEGIYHAMNKGIIKSKGDYLIFLNSGDYFFNELSLKELVRYLGEYDLIYGDVIQEGAPNSIKIRAKLDFNYFLTETIGHGGALIKKTLFNIVGYYNEDNKIVSDWEFFLKSVILFDATYLHVDCLVTVYQLGGISLDPQFNELQKQERIDVLRRYFKHYFSLVNENESLRKEIFVWNKLKGWKGIIKLILSQLGLRNLN
jgi:glycosyltransferase involved in cell wall biosynthesis